MTRRDETGAEREGEGAGKGKERRAGSGHRVTFEALVAVGGQGAGYEAESVDVSREGMRLRTAYLPMPGDQLICRFDGGTGEIAVRGEVAWCNEEARGGEFGVSFLDLDEATAKALRALVEGDDAVDADAADAPAPPKPATTKGHRVRLHIEGLGSPMKARVRDGDDTAVHVGSALEFLKVGRTLELEDVDLGARREAWVDDVQVEVDPQSSVPQLVVSLRFDAIGGATRVASQKREAMAARIDKAVEAEEPVASKRASRPPSKEAGAKEAAPATKRAGAVAAKTAIDEEGAASASDADEDDDVLAMRRGRLHDVGDKLKSGAGAAMGKIGPAMSGLGERAKSLWGKAQDGIQRRREKKEEEKPRRVTAPAPSGALKATGRRVVRAEEEDLPPESELPARSPNRRRTAAIGAIVGLVAVLGFWGITRASGDDPEVMTAAELRKLEAPAEKMPAIPGAPAMADVPLFGATPLSTTEQVVMPPAAISGQAAAGAPPGDDEEGGEAEEDEGKPSAPAQRKFGQGEVKNAKVLRVKMDGPVQGLKGEEVDGGFAITIPGRKSTASVSSLVRKDKRIEAIDVVNKEDGAVLTVKFKGGEVPAYLAQVKGDRIEIALGSASSSKSDGEGPAKKVAAKSKKKSKGDAKKKKD